MICLFCSNETPNEKFCSKSCAASFNNRGIRRHGNARPTCLFCDGPVGKNSTKFCSNKCQGQWRWHQQELRIESADWTVSPVVMRKYLLLQDIQCSQCPVTTHYNGKPISLEIDHIDGNAENNLISNVRLLCPNCHSQTPNYKSKNKHNPNGLERRKQRYLRQVKNGTPGGIRTPDSELLNNSLLESD